MLWDPSFATWQIMGVRANSQMMLIASDLSGGSELIYGFSEDQRNGILQALSSF